MADSDLTIDEIRSMIPAIRSEDKSLRLRSISNLHLIARALGPQRTRDELLPFTVDAPDHEDAALKALARILGQMFKEVGGFPYVSTLLSALSFLCENENVRIRSIAIDSLIHLADNLSPAELASSFLPFIRGLCDDPWFPLRCSAAILLCRLYDRLKATEPFVLELLLTALATDAIVFVKRSLVQSLTFLCEIPEKPPILFKVVTVLAKDESPSIAVEIPSILALLGRSNPDFVRETAELVLASPLWQARSMLIEKLPEIFPVNPPKDFIRKIAGLNGLAAIRAAVARQLSFLFQTEALDDFEGFTTGLITDLDPGVKIAAANAIGTLPPAAARVAEAALEVVLADRDLDVQMAGLRSVSATGLAGAGAGKHLANVAAAGNWRAKIDIVQLIPKIARSLEGEVLSSIVSLLFGDDADQARSATIGILPPLIAQFGEPWRVQVVDPLIRKFSTSIDYHLRQTAVVAVISLGLETKEFADVIAAAAKDQVPNVRAVVAKELPRGNELLAILRGDSDPDVAFYASKQ